MLRIESFVSLRNFLKLRLVLCVKENRNKLFWNSILTYFQENMAITRFKSLINSYTQTTVCILFKYFRNYVANAATWHLYMQESRYRWRNIRHVYFTV